MEQYIKFWEQAVKETEKFKVVNLTASDDDRLFKPVSEIDTIDWDMETLSFFRMLIIDYLKSKDDFDLEKDIRDVITVSFMIGGVPKK